MYVSAGVWMCVYVGSYADAHLCILVCVYVFICVCVYVGGDADVYSCMYLYVCMFGSVFVRVCVCM